MNTKEQIFKVYWSHHRTQ